MSTSNPFDKLNVKREEEDEEQEFHQVKGKEKNIPYGIEQKKKKVRPKEVENKEEGNEEGFEEVGKTKKRRGEDNVEEEGESKVHKKRRGVNYNTQEERDHRLQDKPKRGRQFDRQSGTGRGKEIAKGGAGGKGTWGDNPKNIAKRYQNYNDDDYYIESALNPEKNKDNERPRRPRREYKKDNEEKEGEEKAEEGEEKKEERKEKFKPRPIEIKEEDKLHRPENEMSLDDYLKSKKKPKEEEPKEVERIKDGKPLTKNEKKQEEVLGTTGLGKKKEKKKKEKKVQKEELNIDFEVGGGNDFRREGGDRRRRGGRGKGGRGGRFKFNAEEFPELK